MSGLMGRFAYISDNGTSYAVKGDASNAGQTGGVAVAPGFEKPGRMRPRYLLAQSPTTGRERKVVVYDPAIALWTDVAPATILLYDEANRALAPVAHQIRARVGEKRYT